MSIKNIHSLISGKWFIHESYGYSLLPSLFSIIEGQNISITSDEIEPEVFVSSKKSKSNLIAADSFNNESNNDQYVAVINLKNPIYKYNQECGPAGTKSKMAIMENYAKDSNCVGIVLDIDSGGGQVSGTPEFYDYIKSYSKPVVSYTDGMMCSAAYYIGSAANHIIANNRADAIGSIGVMVHFIDVSGIYEKMGAKVITEYATRSTEKNKPFEELLKGNPELYIKTELDPIAEDFINDIKAVRSNVDKSVFAGGTWNASDSLSKGLIDSLGTLQDAINKAFELSKTSKNNSNKTNSKNKVMSKKTKNFAEIQKLVSIEGEGIPTLATITGKKGVQLTEAQLETIEAALSGNAVLLQTEKDNVTAEKEKVTGLTSAVTEAVTTAGLTSAATPEANIKMLGEKVAEYGAQPGAKPKTPKSDGDNVEEESIVDANAAHNKVYNSI
ncbi:hypothetical protein G6N05_05335 [Flavobacterium sp. F372]|uniref:S49 family peptidase n=1 Tax=Flavobacterium bernardetii TaxID=2813823 RepID=A0ABR7J1I4_9FLAO|nr:S49 family peptidase [Flavobacterium bernardetii]MBC5835803.1 S49 family peptidase [Flavobacterium bernardetii]NHF69534.1 hypothetical protein [Flavobacterium bernardetii]